MASRMPGGGRRTVDDWLQAGYGILADDGLQGLKIDRLCDRLGVTKGSFYWHFADLAAYRAALIESWGAQRGDEHSVYQQIRDQEPRVRLSAMVALLVSPRHFRLELTMREWARSDPGVAASVAESDRRVQRAVYQVFLDLGFTQAEAELRTGITFAAGIGFLQSGQSADEPLPLTTAQRERFLEFMLRE